MRRRLTPPCVARVNASVLHSSRYCRAVYVEHSARSARSRHGPRQVHGGSTVSIEPPLHHPTSPPIFGTHRTHHPWGAASVNLDALLTHIDTYVYKTLVFEGSPLGSFSCVRYVNLSAGKDEETPVTCSLQTFRAISFAGRIPKGVKRPLSCMSRESTLYTDHNKV